VGIICGKQQLISPKPKPAAECLEDGDYREFILKVLSYYDDLDKAEIQKDEKEKTTFLQRRIFQIFLIHF